MTEVTQATRAIVTIANLTIEGFQMPDGTYRISQAKAAECVGITVDLFQSYLNSKVESLDEWDGYEVENVMVDETIVKVIENSVKPRRSRAGR